MTEENEDIIRVTVERHGVDPRHQTLKPASETVFHLEFKLERKELCGGESAHHLARSTLQ